MNFNKIKRLNPYILVFQLTNFHVYLSHTNLNCALNAVERTEDQIKLDNEYELFIKHLRGQINFRFIFFLNLLFVVYM